MPSVLLVLTSNKALGDTGEVTGWYLPEVAHPYYVFKRAGFEVHFASPQGGPGGDDNCCDPGSIDLNDEENKQFWEGEGRQLTSNTLRLADCSAANYDCVFFAGGFGTMWDFPDDEHVQRLAREVYEAGGVVSAVCHGPCALTNVELSNGDYLVGGREVAAFTNEEEDAVSRRDVVPFTCEDRLQERGGRYTKGGVFQAHVARDGRLVTGQNPPSARPTAEAVVELLTPPSAVLHYFPMRGRAEQIRLALSEANWEWSMPESVDFGAMKAEGLLAFGSLPMLETEGLRLVQGNAIMRYVGRRSDLYPSNDDPVVQWKCDALMDSAEDFRIAALKAIPRFGGTEETKQNYISTGVPRFLGQFSRLLEEGQDFFCGGTLSIADISVFDVLDNCAEGLVPGSLDGYPNLKAFHSRIAARPRIAAYLASDRRAPAFPAL